MYRILPPSVIIAILVGAGAGAMAIIMIVWELVTQASVGLLQIPSFVSMVVFIIGTLGLTVAGIYWRGLWRKFPLLGRIFPDLNGSWEGPLESTWIDPETNEQIAPIPATVTVKQGLLGISICMRTGKMKSFSTRFFPERVIDSDIVRVWYSYEHEPTAESQPGNPPHKGFAYIEFDPVHPERLEGKYYTDRLTSGSFTLIRNRDEPR